jgi:hypothetical protein
VPSALELIGLALKEGSPYLVNLAREYINGDELEKTQAIQKESFAKMHAVLTEPAAAEHGEECPTCSLAGTRAMRQVVGNRTWILLHSVADSYEPAARERTEAFVRGIIHAFPCKPCSQDAEAYLSEHPLDFSSRKSLQRSLCRLHNHVNAKVGHPQHPCKV